MSFFSLEPEVAGGFGPRTELDAACHPPFVSKLEYRFDGWLGDELLESFPCFIVSAALKEKILSTSLSGVQFDSLLISVSGEFEDLHPDLKLPEFSWLKIVGHQAFDDFFFSPDHRLIVSERALATLKTSTIDRCSVSLWQPVSA